MGSFSITHWLILLVVVVVVFGSSKLRNAVKGFKEAVKDENTEHAKKQVVLDHDGNAHPIDHSTINKVDDANINSTIDDNRKV